MDFEYSALRSQKVIKLGYTGEKKKEYARLWIAKRRADFFADKQCVKCGSTDRLELDHIDPKLKIDHKIWSWSEVRRLAEIAKCQVLCHNCHVEKTILNKERARGVDSGASKLNDNLVREIRSKFATGKYTKYGLGREYKVDEKAIRELLLGNTWAHVG